MPVREKSAWASLATLVLVFVPYFVQVCRSFFSDQLDPGEVLGLFIGAVVLQIILQIGIHIVFAFVPGDDRTDERDEAIEAKSLRWAYAVFGAMSMSWVLMVLVLANVPETPAPVLGPLWLTQQLVFCFVIAEAVKYLVQAISYRRGI
jgi:hypothetical protein